MNLHAAKARPRASPPGRGGHQRAMKAFKLKKSLETASKLGVRFALILGENEVNSGQYALKNLSTGEQASVGKERDCRDCSHPSSKPFI